MMAERSGESAEIRLALEDDASNQGEGARAVNAPTAAQSLDLSPYRSSSRGGGGGEGHDRDHSRGRRSPERNQRELEAAHQQIAQMQAMLEDFQRRFREMERERFREVRERPDEEHDWHDRQYTRSRATDRTEVSGRGLYPGDREPVTSTPLRQEGFDLDRGQSPAEPTARPAMWSSVANSGGVGLGEPPGRRLEANVPVCSAGTVTRGRLDASIPMGSAEAATGGRLDASFSVGSAEAATGGRLDASFSVGSAEAATGGRLDALATMNPVGAVFGGRSGAQATMNPVGAVFGGRSGAQATMNLVGAVFDGRSDAQATMTPVGAVLGGRSGAEATMGSARPGEPFVPRLGEVLGRTVLSAQPVADPGRVPPGTSGKVTFSDVGFQSVGGGGGQRGPHVRISDYDGETDLTAFLSRFDRVAQLYRWSEDEQMIHLETSLKGAAADIVYDIEPTTTIEEMKDMLRLRFGTDRQGEVTRTELQHTRRQSGEPLQKLYRTIKKLMSVGYPGGVTAMKNWIGRDHFLRALNDDQLCIQVSIQKPQTLEEALTAALELEALGVGREGERLRRETQAGSSQRDRPPRTPQIELA